MTACVTGAEKPLRVALELAQHIGRDLRRREAKFAKLNARHFAGFTSSARRKGKSFSSLLTFFEAAAHEPLDGIDDPLRRLDERLARAVAHGDRGAAAIAAELGRAPPPTAPDSSHPRRESPPAHRLPYMRPGSWWFPGRFRLRASLPPCSSFSSQSFGHVADQIAEVAPPVEQSHHLLLRRFARGRIALVPRLPLRAQIPIHFSSRPSNFLLACSRLSSSSGSASPILRAMRISSSCMFSSKTSSSRSAGTRDGPSDPYGLCRACSSPISAPFSLSRYSVRRSGSFSVR